MDCVFCKIISGYIPSFKIYEDEYTLAFMDIAKDVGAKYDIEEVFRQLIIDKF